MRIQLPSGTPAENTGPTGGNPSLGVVIAPDIMGLRPLFDEMAQRLADEHGWAVCAVEPYPGQEQLSLDERRTGTLDDHRILRDLLEAKDVLGCDLVAIIGFCMGGMQVYKAMGTGEFARGVSFYGMIHTPEQWRGSATVEPIDQLRHAGGRPVLAIVGGRDTYTPPDHVSSLGELPHVEVVEYPEAEHGFVHDPSRPAHRPDDAADAWRRTIDFLKAAYAD